MRQRVGNISSDSTTSSRPLNHFVAAEGDRSLIHSYAASALSQAVSVRSTSYFICAESGASFEFLRVLHVPAVCDLALHLQVRAGYPAMPSPKIGRAHV